MPDKSTFTIGKDVSQLYLEVHQADGKTISEIRAPGEYASDGNRQAPQAFVILDANSDWKWPEERATIGIDAYTSFSEWGANAQEEWYKSSDGKLYNASPCTWEWTKPTNQ